MRSRFGTVALLTLALAAAPTTSPLAGAQPGRSHEVSGAPYDPAAGLLLQGTVVTMNAAREVVRHGRVLVRDGRIAAIWKGPDTPDGIDLTGVTRIDLDPDALIFPGLINLHDHPLYSVLPLWVPPSTHQQGDRGRPLGIEPYANRYQWNVVTSTSPPEYRRLVDSPNVILTNPAALNLQPEVVKYAEVKALLGGTAAMQGAPAHAGYDTMLARNVDNLTFGRDRIESRVASIASLGGATQAGLIARMKAGQVDAWIVHLAEGVRDADRRANDTTSSRAEFAALAAKGLLNDTAVIVHGVGLEATDFAAMAGAPPARADGIGDGRGAKLVWSPLSNLLLYGQTAQVYEALAAGVTVALGTDWSPSGSPNLLAELKVADRALRDERLLGGARNAVPALAIDGKHGRERRHAERALDRLLVEMVTINAAQAVRWDDQVGSIEVGKVADLLVIANPRRPGSGRVSSSPYRGLIEASEADVRLVMVGGEAMAGDVDLMAVLKPGDTEVIGSTGGCFAKAIDVTAAGPPNGTQTLSAMLAAIDTALAAIAGDNPPAGDGPADVTNTYTYLRSHSAAGAGLTDAAFMQQVLIPLFGLTGGKLNLEAVQRAPAFAADDDWFQAILAARLDGFGMIDDSTPPYKPYAGNLNHVGSAGNPLVADGSREQSRARCRK